MKNRLAIGSLILLSASVAHSASFDCAKASTFVEKAICSDPKISRQDDVLGENYKYVSASNIGDGARKDLKATQRAWMAARNKCDNNECITNAYRKRIDEVCEYPVLSGAHPGCTSADDVEAEFATKQQAPAQAQKTSPKPQENSQSIASAQEKTSIQNTELEQAWACKPGITPFQDNESSLVFFDCESVVYPQLVRPNTPPELIRRAKLILETYHINLRNKNTFKEFLEEAKIREQRAQEKANSAQQAKNERVRKLRAGEIKIATMEDALAVYPDKGVLLDTAISPLLTPSGAVMTGYVVLDAQEKPGFIRSKITTAIAIQSGQEGGGSTYIYLTLTKQSVNFAPDKLRINGSAQVIGKYVQNVQYQTVAGQQKIAPVIEVMYINPIR
jgi:uncharacterized protein